MRKLLVALFCTMTLLGCVTVPRQTNEMPVYAFPVRCVTPEYFNQMIGNERTVTESVLDTSKNIPLRVYVEHFFDESGEENIVMYHKYVTERETGICVLHIGKEIEQVEFEDSDYQFSGEWI